MSPTGLPGRSPSPCRRDGHSKITPSPPTSPDSRNNGGQITSETARLTVSPPIPFRMDTPTVLTRGDIELRIHTTPGRRYQIQTSQDLKTWTNTGTAVTATGVTTVTRIPKSTAPRQFLRTRQLPNP